MRNQAIRAGLVAILLAGLAAPRAHAQLSPAGEGRRLYLKLNCYGCHGLFGAGGMGPNLRGEAEAGDVREAVMQGEEGGMPSFHAYVSTADVKNLIAYLQSLGKTGEPVFTHWWESVPSQ